MFTRLEVAMKASLIVLVVLSAYVFDESNRGRDVGPILWAVAGGAGVLFAVFWHLVRRQRSELEGEARERDEVRRDRDQLNWLHLPRLEVWISGICSGLWLSTGNELWVRWAGFFGMFVIGIGASIHMRRCALAFGEREYERGRRDADGTSREIRAA